MFAEYVVWVLMGIFPDNGLASNPEAQRAYARALEEVPEVELKLAVRRWIKVQKRFPCPAELIELAAESREAA